MSKIYIAGLLIVMLSFNGNKLTHTYEGKDIKITWETLNGRFDGKYVSYYKNGIKKAEGHFDNNCRSGIWTIYDSTGNVLLKRKYTEPFNFETLLPKQPDKKYSRDEERGDYELNYNEHGYIDYYDVKPQMVVWQKSIWRMLKPGENPLIFKNNRLYKLLNKNIINNKITAYNAEEPHMTESSILENNPDTTNKKLIGFHLKEQYFIDSIRWSTESRIISISPVVVNKTTDDTLELYKVYCPNIRKQLAREKIIHEAVPERINTLDDLFFFEYYSGAIIKESNVYDRTISDYKTGDEIQEEAERIEISMIERQHDLWVRFLQEKQ